MRENTYWPELCLVQIANDKEAAAIDPMAPGIDLTPLLDLMCDNEDVLKVFHAGGQDVEIIYNLTGKTPHPIFDTQIAMMAISQSEQIGYANLVESWMGIDDRQGRALHRLEPPPADRPADRICHRRRHLSLQDLPADPQETDQDRARRLARRRDGKARRSGELPQRSGPGLAADPRAVAQSGGARPAEGAGRLARARGAGQEHPARTDHARRNAGRHRQPSAQDPGRSRQGARPVRRPGATTISAGG